MTSIAARTHDHNAVANHHLITARFKEDGVHSAARLVEGVPSLSLLRSEFHHFLHENSNPYLARLFEWAELKSGTPRDKLASGFLLVVAFYLIIGSGAELLCNSIGMVYPAYASVKAVRSEDKSDDTHWLTYWTVFAVFSIVDFFSESIMGFLPLYWVGKTVFLLYIALPQTGGALKLYTDYVDPAVTKMDEYFAKYLAKYFNGSAGNAVNN